MSFWAAVVLWGFVIFCVVYEDSNTVFGEWQTWVTDKFTWLYIISQERLVGG